LSLKEDEAVKKSNARDFTRVVFVDDTHLGISDYKKGEGKM